MTDVTANPETPVTFQAYAERIGMSRPYVSKLVTTGVIVSPALTPDRKIIPSLADAQRADAATRPKSSAADLTAPSSSGTLNAARLDLTRHQAERAALENSVRRGELVPRDALAAALPPLARRYAETLGQLVRDTITDDVERAALTAAIHTATTQFIAEALTNGGAPPA